MTPTADLNEDEKRSHRRFWWIMGSTLVLALTILGYVVFIYDGAPPDDAWMLPKPFPPAAGSYSLPEFQKRNLQITEDWEVDPAKTSEDVLLVTSANVAERRALVEKHRALLKEFEAFLAANPGVLPFPYGDAGLNFSGPDRAQYSVLLPAVKLAALEARVLAHEGKSRESLHWSLALIKLGHQISERSSMLIDWVHGMIFQDMGRRTLESCAPLLTLSDGELKTMEDTLTAWEFSSQSYKTTLQGQYLCIKRSLGGVKGGNPVFLPFKNPASYFFERRTLKVNTTLTKMLDLERPLFEACGKDWKTAVQAEKEMARRSAEFDVSGPWRYFSDNIAGNFLLRAILMGRNGFLAESAGMVALHRQMVLMLALRRFEQEHGTLPKDLEELCPQYLAVVPLDPFDNHPMRWNPITKTLYSVGKNLKDDGGSSGALRTVYWWAPKPPETPSRVPTPMRRR